MEADTARMRRRVQAEEVMNRDTSHAGEGTVQFFVFLAVLLVTLVLAGIAALVAPTVGAVLLALGIIIGLYTASRVKVIAQWENAPLMKFGKVRGFATPGVNFIPPFYKIYD